jgi:hypothetical protein
LRSGRYNGVNKEQSAGNDVRASSDDFLGYERSYYSVEPGEGQTVKIVFRSAEVWQNGKFNRRPRTSLPLFDPIADASYVRLIFFARLTNADHNMAVAAAYYLTALDAITRGVISSAVCGTASGGICIWVPAGVAVIPEKRLMVNGKRQWAPAR